MSIALGIFTFINTWWVSLFIVVPFHVRRDDTPAAKDYVAAPKPLPWKKVLWINTVFAAVITLALALIIHLSRTEG